jgi:hypothetical protein
MSSGKAKPMAVGVNHTVAASTTSVEVLVSAAWPSVRVYNATDGVVFMRIGSAGEEANETNAVAIPPGGVESFEKGTAPAIQLVLDAGTGKVYLTEGDGI